MPRLRRPQLRCHARASGSGRGQLGRRREQRDGVHRDLRDRLPELRGLKSDLATAIEHLTAARAQIPIDAADANAAALALAEAERRRTIAIMEDLKQELGDLAEKARRQDAEIRAPPEDNGPVPPVLGDFLLRRFGERDGRAC